MAKEYEYLDLLERKLDEQQRQVCCRTDNSVVAAGAGSGKTQVLATRFAWLVMSKNIKASSILTLTFTNKAACEMYSRIYQTLKKFSLD
ncbi:MAG: UvrD-helicase domain-containing protein, partial [Treponema sp.]|nr:UvrD-helicase domain-containing protein [Treponema sp.]